MDVSYSAWQRSTVDSLVLKGDSFSFLFDRRYANRLNRMSRVFFEAYAKATNELAAKEDRFPSLSEIDAKMASGAVYAFKDRLMKNTEFFEEVKISGVSYLVPRAKQFIDATGTYTDLAFNFEAGTATLPTRRKTPAPIEPAPAKEPEPEAAPPLAPPPEPAVDVQPQKVLPMDLPQKQPEPYPEMEVLEPGPEEPTESAKPAESAPIQEIKTPPPQAEPAYRPQAQRKPDQAKDHLRKGGLAFKPITVAVAVLILAAIIAGAYYLPGMLAPSAPVYVEYSAFLANSTADANSTNTSLNNIFQISLKNPSNMGTEMEMMLPRNIDRSISAMGGVFTIAHTNSTIIRLNASTDAVVRVDLSKNETSLPVVLDLAVPEGYDSGLVVHDANYDVKRVDNRIVLKFNCTASGISFEQSYTKKR
ncbi:MAG TPA: hypothetical protein VN455_08005 [Methanotrichaceae archaeon]|nr:hypothetical protein [Methanotrichaceae archaeon]